MKLLNYFSFLDVFQAPVPIYFDSNPKIATLFGILCSLLMFGILIYSFFQSDMFLKRDPFVSNYYEVSQNGEMTLDDKNFAPTISFIDILSQTAVGYDPSILQIYINQVSNVKKLNKVIGLKNCNESDFKGISLSSIDFENKSCFNDSFTISKEYGTQLQILVRKCIPNASNITCKSEEEINKFLSKKAFFFTFLSFLFQPEDLNEPFKSSYQFLAGSLNADQAQFHSLAIVPIDFEDDSNVLWDDKQYKSYIEDSQNSLLTKKFDDVGFYYFLQISQSDMKKTIVRKYEKLSAALGKIGGLASLMSIFFKVLVQISLNLKILNKTISKLFTQKQKGGNETIGQKEIELPVATKIEINNLKGDSDREKGTSAKLTSNLPNNEKDLLDGKFQKTQKNDLRISIFTYLRYLLKKSFRWTLNNEERTIELFEKECRKQFDILLIVKKVNGYEKIKKILFDENQKKLFDFLEQPKISFDMEMSIMRNSKEDNDIKISFEEAVKIKNGFLKKDKLSEIDRRLLKSLGV